MSMISYAQNGEDVVLRRVFPNGHRGLYIDVGANNPLEPSKPRFRYERSPSYPMETISAAFAVVTVRSIARLIRFCQNQYPREKYRCQQDRFLARMNVQSLVRCEVSGRLSYLPNGEESGEPLASLWPMSPCGRLGPVFQAPLFRLDGILGRACA